MTEKNLGKVGITTEGQYSSSRSYSRLTMVSYEGESWISKTDVPIGIVPTEANSQYWQKAASRGAQGNSGYQGAADELEVVNNLIDGGEAAALSAEMGKKLKKEIAAIYGEESSVEIKPSSLLTQGGYVRFADGVFIEQGVEGNTVYLIHRSAFEFASSIKVTTKAYDDIPAAVAFYTTTNLSTSGYIKGKSVQSKGQGDFIYDAEVPDEANLIAITFANATNIGQIVEPSIVLDSVNVEPLFIPRESITQSLGESKDMVLSQYAVTNFLGKEDVDLYPLANKMRGYVKYTTGEFIGNGSDAENMSFIIPNNGYNRILVKTTSGDNVPAAIAFYNTSTIDVNGYLSDYSIRARMGLRCHNSVEYDVLVPKEAKIIVVHGYGFSVSEVVPEIISISDTSKYISYDKVSKQIAENNDSVVSSSAIAAALKGECLQNLPLGSAEIITGYISYLTGELTGYNSQFENYVLKYDVSNLQGAKMKISTAAYDNVPAAVSFFSSNEISSASYIAGLVAKEGISNYEVVIPNDAVIMAVTWASGLAIGEIYPAPIIEKYFDYGFIRKDEVVNRESTDIRLPQLRVTSSFLTIAGDQISGLTTNKNEVAVNYSFISKGHCFTDTGRISYQGNSTMYHTKKGFSIDFDNKHRFGDWLEFDGFHCKAYFTDWMHFRDIACNKIYEYMMQSRPASHRRPYMAYNDFSASDIDMLADTGRLCHIDGFPVELYINDAYWGLYSINLKKHRDNYKLGKNNELHIMLDPDNTYVNASLNWRLMEVRNPKNITNADGSKYDGDAPQEIADGAVKTSIMRLMNFFSSVGGSTTKETFAEYLNLEEAVDDILLAKFICNWDFGGKNTLYTTWDGTHWSMLNYDNDATFGIFEDPEGYPFGDVVVDPTYEPFNKKAYSFCPWLSRLESVLSADLAARYAELRSKGVFSKSLVENLCKEWINRIGSDVLADDTARWSYPGLGNAKSSGINENFIDSVPRLLTWVEQRIAVLDEKYNYSNEG